MPHPMQEPPVPVFDNLQTLVALNSRDWSADRADAWLYGVICGWNDDPAEETDGMETLRSIGAQHQWSDARIEQLGDLHRQWSAAKRASTTPEPTIPTAVHQVLDDLETRAGIIHAKGSTSLAGVRSNVRADGYLEAVRLIRAAAGL